MEDQHFRLPKYFILLLSNDSTNMFPRIDLAPGRRLPGPIPALASVSRPIYPGPIAIPELDGFLQEKMMQRCGEAHPQGLRALLGLQLPEQNGKSADEALWRRVLVSLPPTSHFPPNAFSAKEELKQNRQGNIGELSRPGHGRLSQATPSQPPTPHPRARLKSKPPHATPLRPNPL